MRTRARSSDRAGAGPLLPRRLSRAALDCETPPCPGGPSRSPLPDTIGHDDLRSELGARLGDAVVVAEVAGRRLNRQCRHRGGLTEYQLRCRPLSADIPGPDCDRPRPRCRPRSSQRDHADRRRLVQASSRGAPRRAQRSERRSSLACSYSERSGQRARLVAQPLSVGPGRCSDDGPRSKRRCAQESVPCSGGRCRGRARRFVVDAGWAGCARSYRDRARSDAQRRGGAGDPGRAPAAGAGCAWAPRAERASDHHPAVERVGPRRADGELHRRCVGDAGTVGPVAAVDQPRADVAKHPGRAGDHVRIHRQRG